MMKLKSEGKTRIRDYTVTTATLINEYMIIIFICKD